jgi:hypothetical protein
MILLLGIAWAGPMTLEAPVY